MTGGAISSVLRRYAWSIGPFVVFLTVLGIASVLSALGRSSPTGSSPIDAATASEVYSSVTASGLRGGTLVLFDDFINTMDKDERYQYFLARSPAGEDYPADETNLTSALVSSGAVRRTIVIVPDPEWSRRQEYFSSAWDFFSTGTGYRLRFAGAPIEIYAASTPPPLPGEEDTLVLIDSGLETSYPSGLIDRWTDPRVADLVIRQGVRQ